MSRISDIYTIIFSVIDTVTIRINKDFFDLDGEIIVIVTIIIIYKATVVALDSYSEIEVAHERRIDGDSICDAIGS